MKVSHCTCMFALLSYDYYVTLYRMLHSEREVISDVPCIYFCLPNQDNINRICNDIKAGLYESYYLNFASPIPKDMLEKLAHAALESDSVSKIAKVYDQYCNYISLDDYLFHMNMDNSYISFHDPHVGEESAQINIDRIVESLFAVIVSMGVVPIIQCPTGDAAEMIAQRLDRKIREHLSSEDNILDGSTWNRPVLILLDRNVDLSVMVAHSWSYQGLIHDLLKYKLNRVTLEVIEEDKKSGEKRKVVRSYDLDSTETFFASRCSSPFSKVAVEIQQAVDEVKSLIKRNISLDNDSDDSDPFSKTKDMSSFVSSLPEVQERKRLLDIYTNIALALLEQIKERNLDEFFSLEETIMTKPALSHKKSILTMLNGEKGSLDDKLRLFLIYYMSKQNDMDPSEIKEFEEIMENLGIDTLSFKYLRKIHAFNEVWSTTSSQPMQSGKGKDFIKSFKGIFSTGVQYLLPSNKDFYVTRIVDAITEIKTSNGVDKYLYFDPKFPPKQTPRKNTPFKEAIVFMIGGGNYNEMHNIQEYVKNFNQTNPNTAPKRVIYGTTEVLNPCDFVKQLSDLSKAVNQ